MSSTNKNEDEDEEIDPNKVLQADNQNKDYFSNDDDIDNGSGDNDKFKDFNFEDIKKEEDVKQKKEEDVKQKEEDNTIKN